MTVFIAVWKIARINFYAVVDTSLEAPFTNEWFLGVYVQQLIKNYTVIWRAEPAAPITALHLVKLQLPLAVSHAELKCHALKYCQNTVVNMYGFERNLERREVASWIRNTRQCKLPNM